MATLRITLIVVALLCTAPLASTAQPASKVYRIGMLDVEGPAANADNLRAFRQGLRDLGYVEGQNFVLAYRSAEGRPERLLDLATELARLEVDVIVTRGTPAALSTKQATRTIPIVMAASGDPAGEGIVRNLARPGGNVTGFHVMAPPEVGATRLRLLKEAVPASSRVGVLWNQGDVHAVLIVREMEKVAAGLGVKPLSLELRRPGAFDQAFEAALLDQVDSLVVVEGYFTYGSRSRIVDFAALSRLPAIYGLREFVDAGGLMSYGTDHRDLFRRAAIYVHEILKGARPADLPITPPLKLELAINLKTAKALGLTLPSSLLGRADYIVE